MKRKPILHLMLVLSVLLFGLSNRSVAQEVVLPEVEVVAVNYKYLTTVQNEEVAIPVKELEKKVASFDLKNSEHYNDEYDHYVISFYIPEGTILAAYDREGKLIRTAEKFKNVALPQAVTSAIAKKYPNWSIKKDIYMVKYYDKKEASKKYKLVLEKGDKRIKVKTNEKGDFI